MLSPELQPHGFSPVVVGENSRTLPQLPTEGLKRVLCLRIARSASSRKSLEIPTCQMLAVVTLAANRDYDPFGCRVTLREFHEDPTVILNSRSKGQASILIARLVVRGLVQPKEVQSDTFLCIDAEISAESRTNFLPRVLLGKKSGPHPVSCLEDKP